MAKKFGKFLLFTAAVGTAAAAAYYFVRKKEADLATFQDDDDDYDDFSDYDDADASRSYVPLNMDGQDTAEANTDSVEADVVTEFTPLADQIAQDTEDKSEEVIEEFFDEEDSSDEEPPISDN